MRQTDWSRPVSDTEAWHRAGARLRYNTERQIVAEARQHEVFTLLWVYRKEPRHLERIATELGVSRSTVWRDRTALRMRHARLLRLIGQEEEAGEG